jgi:acyl carrier protein
MTKDKFIEMLCREYQQSDDDDFDINQITEKSKLTDIDGFDSLSVLSLVTLIQKKFGVTIIEKKLNNVDTIGGLIELIGLEHFKD